MHKSFNETHPSETCYYELYRSIVQKINISFTNLGHEECEVCEIIEVHCPAHSKENLIEDCNICEEWILHKKRAAEARQKHSHDIKDSVKWSDTAYFSIDLQKGIMLPRMNELKVSIFTRRIVAFNENFVRLGSTEGENKI